MPSPSPSSALPRDPGPAQPEAGAALLSASLELPGEAATERLAQALTQQPGQLATLRIDLRGTLGAGKTTWVRHVLRALGVQGRIKSPTYALLEPYTLEPHGFEAFHFDLYRLDDPQEWIDSGLQETVQGPGLKLIEWPQKAGELLGRPDLCVVFELVADDGDRRRAHLLAYSTAGQQLLQNMLKTFFV